MKNLLFAFLLTLPRFIDAQEKFVYNENGLTDFIVVDIDSLSQSELYNKTIKWVKETLYKNPGKVLKATSENNKIRLNGFKESAFIDTSTLIHGFSDARYSLEISFEKGKYKIDPINLEVFKNLPDKWKPVILDSGNWLFKKNGEIKKRWNTYPIKFANLFNDLHLSLYDYILKESGKIIDTDNDW